MIRSSTGDNACTKGIVAYVWEERPEWPLFLIAGGYRTYPAALKGIEVVGTAFTYDDYPWPEGMKITKGECRERGQIRNGQYNLTISQELREQFVRLLATHPPEKF